MGRYRNLKHEYDGLVSVYDEEVAAKENLARQCAKAEEELALWRLRYEKDGLGRIEELESSKLKLQARLAECEETVANMNGKLIQLERSRAQLQEPVFNFRSTCFFYCCVRCEGAPFQ